MKQKEDLVMAKEKQKMSGKKKLIAIISVVLVMAIVMGTCVFIKYKEITGEPETTVKDTLVYDFDGDEELKDGLEDDPIFDEIYEKAAGSFKDSIKAWATNGGEVMYSNHVINILCAGVDTRNPDAVAGLTDTMMILSINTELKTLTLTSIMRDSFAYVMRPDGTGGSFNKINSAFPFYGVDGLIPAIENHFKVRIDGYALINFALFKAAIDKLGGVTVPVQQYEANYMNATYPNVSFEVGDAVTLTGDEALAFCRSRKCDNDGDVSRTRRQRQVIMAALQKCVNIKASEVTDYVSTFLPYIETSYSSKDILSLATKAVTDGWATYEIKQVLAPSEASRRGYMGSSWFWAVDYPLAAQDVQTQIYGESNIVLEEDRTTAIELLTRYGEFYYE